MAVLERYKKGQRERKKNNTQQKKDFDNISY